MFFQDEEQYREQHHAGTEEEEQPATEKHPEQYVVQEPVENQEQPTDKEQEIINQQNAETNARLHNQTEATEDNDKK